MFDDIMDAMQQENSVVKGVLTGESKIQNKVEIEDVLLEIRRIEREAEFLKDLKKHRVAPIDRRIKESEQAVEVLRTAILACMQEKNESKLDFPDVAKISTRKQSGGFEIADQAQVESHLKGLGIIDSVAEPIWKFDKRKLNKVLTELQENNNLPQGVTTTDPYTAISISFQETADDKSKERERAQEAARWNKPVAKQNETKQNEFDALTF